MQVGFFFSSVLLQRVAQRHVHLLQMRSETERVVVVDLAQPDHEAPGIVPAGIALEGRA